MKNNRFAVRFSNLPTNFASKCKVFYGLDPISLHLFPIKKLKKLIWHDFYIYSASPTKYNKPQGNASKLSCEGLNPVITIPVIASLRKIYNPYRTNFSATLLLGIKWIAPHQDYPSLWFAEHRISPTQ